MKYTVAAKEGKYGVLYLVKSGEAVKVVCASKESAQSVADFHNETSD